MKKKFISIILVIVTTVSCFVISGIPVSALTLSDEGVLPFEDVQANHWFADAAEFCYVNDVINGMNEYTFAPNGKLTRAQFVTMLANIEGVDLTAYSTNQFTDVKSSHWYYNTVAWAYENGIVSGTSVNQFSPNMQINRETLSRIMILYMTNKGYSVTVDSTALDKYTDKGSISSWAVDGMKYMVSSGLISGMTETTVAPKGVVTRAQAARILMLFMQNYLYAGHEHIFSEVTCTESAVCGSCGMVNGLPDGHDFSSKYDCKTGANCTTCGEYVAPSITQHDFAAATCGKPRTCKVCGITRGTTTGKHDWWAATCTNPKMCKVCYKSEGSALGHDYIPATSTTPKTCRRCKQTVGSPARWYGEGTYKVGVDIPAGEYYIKCTSDYSAYFAVCNDSCGDYIITNELFDTHHFVTIKSGQYFELSRGQFISVDGIDKLNVSSSNIGEGMYRVGVDIPAGEYKLTKTSGSIGYVAVYDNSTAYRDILTNDIFNNTDYISVSKGQYLLLSDCKAALTK